MNKRQTYQEQSVSQAVLQCRNIVKHYRQGPNTVEVLKGIDFELHPGERLAIVGASGSGKSTLLNMLGGLDQPSAGDVLLNGQAFSTGSDNERAKLRNQSLGFVYQFHHLLGEFSAQENIAIPKMIAGHSKKQALLEASHFLQQVGLEHRQQHKPSELSGGERQRVAIARALANNPACVLMDEPTGNLDRDTANTIQELLLTLSRDANIAFIVVTHDEQIANAMDRVLTLENGLLKS
ncbi:MAG: lipoprotein-releasing ABC transporter ATP-binding protein LolD [Candidatus Pelagadaptatus aseana]|uniref:lipoprotein-releasing ABC transporter ATP-binding protein LolD n=1 Tax=Candidatus Pelagadaptatus aseana TaxID=3120508 RepID=UPI0039B34F11